MKGSRLGDYPETGCGRIVGNSSLTGLWVGCPLSNFLWAHRNSSPLRPTRHLLSWDLPQIIGHPPRIESLTRELSRSGFAENGYASRSTKTDAPTFAPGVSAAYCVLVKDPVAGESSD